jgi:RNA polymerase sigma-70 factor (ECF subfamily)
MGRWLTTVVARVCLDLLRSRKSRRQETLTAQVPEPVIHLKDRREPETEMVLADSVGVALLVVLETLAPAERIAFVLHYMFDLPFDEIAPIVGRSPTATRQLASRARHRVKGPPTTSEDNLKRQRQVIDAFLAASRHGDFDALLAVLDPDVVLRADHAAVQAAASNQARGAPALSSAVHVPWPRLSRGVPGPHNRRSSTEPWEPFGLRADSREPPSISRLRVGRSSKSACSWNP